MLHKIVTIQDISCYGKCSLTVALPLISAMGVETAVIPTAVLSTHTGGFSGYTFRDLTDDMPEILKHWQSLSLSFDGIYTGYLGSKEQIDIVAAYFDAFGGDGTAIIVDPVMGDNGKLYAGFADDFPQQMRLLCEKADVILPNLTEAELLLGEKLPEQPSPDEVKDILKRLTDIGCKKAVLTGVYYDDAHHGAVGYDRETGEFSEAFRPHIPSQMHGTGDVFSSVFAGAIVRGGSLAEAIQLAVNFTAATMEATLPDLSLPHDRAPWYGVEFEACIPKLVADTAKLLG